MKEQEYAGAFTNRLLRILGLLASKPSIPDASPNSRLVQLFGNPYFDIPDGDSEALFYEVNKKLDAVFHHTDGNTHILGGPYGLEVVVVYLDTARRQFGWDPNAEGLTSLKLDRIISALQGT